MDITMPKHGFVKFTGDYTQLKKLGFRFQKLYARNYMQWEKDGFRVWKRGGDITWDDFCLYRLLKFMETHEIPNVNGYLRFYKFYSDPKRNEFEMRPYNEFNHKIYVANFKEWSKVTDDTPDNELPQYIASQGIHADTLQTFRDLCNMGWVEIVDN